MIDTGLFPREEFLSDNPALTTTQLTGLLPDHNYRVTIYARNGHGRGASYVLEDRTLPNGREYMPPGQGMDTVWNGMANS